EIACVRAGRRVLIRSQHGYRLAPSGSAFSGLSRKSWACLSAFVDVSLAIFATLSRGSCGHVEVALTAALTACPLSLKLEFHLMKRITFLLALLLSGPALVFARADRVV